MSYTLFAALEDRLRELLAAVHDVRVRHTDPDPFVTWKENPVYAVLVSDAGEVVNPRTGNLLGHMTGGGSKGRGRRARRANRYRAATVRANGVQVNLGVHVLVLETFVGPRPKGYEADHLNFDKTDNALHNVRWLPSAHNARRHPDMTA